MPPPSSIQAPTSSQVRISPLKSMDSSPEALEEGFDFSTEPKFFGPFTIFTKTGGKGQFILREALEAGHVAYKDESSKGMKASIVGGSTDNITASIEGTSKADSVLVSKCLFRLVQIKSGEEETIREEPVSLAFVMDLERRITKRLYVKIRSMSGMDESEETEEFLTKRIESDTKKINVLRRLDRPGKGEPSSTTNTS